MEKSTEPAEELGVNHLPRSLPLEVRVVQTVVAVQPGYSDVQVVGVSDQGEKRDPPQKLNIQKCG